jgi:predicted dienelactone hydrolase
MWLSLVRAPAQSASVHQFNQIQMLPDHTACLELGGKPAPPFRPYFDLYLLEASPDLVDWAPLASLLRTNASTNALIYVDQAASTLPQRFYRMPTNLLITPFPAPTGPFHVGSFVRMLTDSSRTNRYNIKTNSSFMATFWYPAQAEVGQWPAPYMEAKLANYYPFWGSMTNVAPSFVSQAFSEAPISTNAAAYPVVIYSHGLSDGLAAGGDSAGLRVDNTETAVELASYGYIVVAVDHIDCFASVFPDGNMVVRGFTFGNVLNNAGYYLRSRFQDVQFLLGQLSQFSQTDPLLAGRLDLDHIGMMGWSFGGSTTAEDSRTNQLIKAVVLLDGYLDPVPDVINLGLQKPFLAMNSPNSGLAPNNVMMFNHSTNTAYILQITGTQHGTFTDEAWTTSPNSVTRLAGQAKDACLVSFFNKILKNQDDHLLDAPAKTYSNVVSFQKKP